jgi:hypothetical protein
MEDVAKRKELELKHMENQKDLSECAAEVNELYIGAI